MLAPLAPLRDALPRMQVSRSVTMDPTRIEELHRKMDAVAELLRRMAEAQSATLEVLGVVVGVMSGQVECVKLDTTPRGMVQ